MAARKRRAPGSGSVVKRGHGNYEARLWVELPDGTMRQKVRRASSEREAVTKLGELKDLYRNSPEMAMTPARRAAVTVEELFPRWKQAVLAEVEDGHLRDKTAADVIWQVEHHILPRWKTRRVAALRVARSCRSRARRKGRRAWHARAADCTCAQRLRCF